MIESTACMEKSVFGFSRNRNPWVILEPVFFLMPPFSIDFKCYSLLPPEGPSELFTFLDWYHPHPGCYHISSAGLQNSQTGFLASPPSSSRLLESPLQNHAIGSCIRVRHQTALVQTRLLLFADSVTLGNALDLFNFQFSYLKNGESDICLKGCGEVEKLDHIYEVLGTMSVIQ